MTTGFESKPATRQIMTQPTNPRASTPFEKLSPLVQWGFLIASSVLLAALFEVAALPAALLLGPMIAGIVVGCNGGTIRPPRLPVFAAQTIIGCLVARAVTGDIVFRFLKDWPLFLSVIIGIVAASTALGWLLTRWKVLPGTTAVWGTAPGGASVMMLMSGAFGADARLVAFMQYLRVVLVAAVASAVARLWLGAARRCHAGPALVSCHALAGFHRDIDDRRPRRCARLQTADSGRRVARAHDRRRRSRSDGPRDDHAPAMAAGRELRIPGLERRLGLYAGNPHSCVARAAPDPAGDLRHHWDLRRLSPSCSCRPPGSIR